MPFHSQKGHQTEPWFWLLDSIMLQNPSKQVFHRHLRKFQDSSSSMKEELYNGWLEINASCFPTSFYTNASRWYNEGCCRSFNLIIGKLDHDECEAQKWQRAARYNDKLPSKEVKHILVMFINMVNYSKISRRMISWKRKSWWWCKRQCSKGEEGRITWQRINTNTQQRWMFRGRFIHQWT